VAKTRKKNGAPSPATPDGKPVAWRPAWEAYATEVSRRLRSGQREYHDESFSADPRRLLQELQQELLDVSGWGFILWQRLERVRQCLEGAKLPPVDKDVEL